MVQTAMKLATSTQALEELMIGNERFFMGEVIHPHQSSKRRAEVQANQEPFALILTCADSQLDPAIIFDQGLGDLYTIRVGGNVVDQAVSGSIELAVQKFDIPLIMVLGHSRCSAVEAAVTGEASGHVFGLIDAIQPALDRAKTEPGDLVDNAVRANATVTAEELRHAEPFLAERFHAGKLKIVAAYYDGVSGEVEILA
jgi:carbonic anhydrase